MITVLYNILLIAIFIFLLYLFIHNVIAIKRYLLNKDNEEYYLDENDITDEPSTGDKNKNIKSYKRYCLIYN